jgi:glycosyltransferase involved in cell wall biosynthesis
MIYVMLLQFLINIVHLSMRTILLCSNTALGMILFRSHLMLHLKKKGFNVKVALPHGENHPWFKENSIEIHYFHLKNKSINPIQDIKTFFSFFNILKNIKPDIMINYTIKPVIYGGLMARFFQIPTLNIVTGLGSGFMGAAWLRTFIGFLYRFTLNKSRVLTLNRDDAQQLKLKNGGILPGEGIVGDDYHVCAIPRTESFIFLMISRIIADKGIMEFVKAAEIITQKYSHVQCHIVGDFYPNNPSAIHPHDLEQYVNSKAIHLLGYQSDVRPFIEQSHCVVLPSYREGIPRVLLEAGIMGRPSIATNVPGCHDVIEDGINGFLCDPQNVDSLMNAMEKMIALKESDRQSMGIKANQIIMNQFDESIVLEIYDREINDLIVNT